jgi:hypothetical protein
VIFLKRLPIGISDFAKLIKNDYYYVDTTKMIGDVYREPSDIILITRPRRFGKTLNMSMLSYYFDNRLNANDLFKELAISKDVEVMALLNGLPTIFLSFKDINNNKWETTSDKLRSLISGLFNQYKDAFKELMKNDYERHYCESILEGTATDGDYQKGLFKLTEYLYKVYKKPVMLIIDEYDVPIQSGWTYGYYDDVIDFMRGLLSAALKDNSFLFKGILTGIYRVAKESIFSGLNNLKVYTVLDERYSKYFGFTQEEVDKLVDSLGYENNDRLKNDLKNWYNGYKFGGRTIYNPWSVVNFLYDKELQPYWINTSSNNLIIEQIEKNMLLDESFRVSIEDLIGGKTIEKRIDDASALRELNYDPDSIWTLFLFSGYLKVENKHLHRQTEEFLYDCSVPNTEVLRFYKKTVINWLQKPARNILYDLADPLITGNGEIFCEKLKKYVMNTLSYFDLKGEPENTYHMILLGMFAHLTGGYWILSNRESGKGRYDICLKAKDKNNYSAVIEIKAKGSQKTVEEAMMQIEEKEYVRDLESEGYTKILKISLAVDGKDIEVISKDNRS